MLKLSHILLVPFIPFLMAFSNNKVDATSVATLHSSLQTILQPLDRSQKYKFMKSFFEISSGVNWTSSEGDLAKHYLSNQRFGQNYQRRYLGGWEAGETAQESMARFHSQFADKVDGMSAHQIMDAAEALRARRLAAYTQHAIDNGPRYAADLQAEINVYERFVPQRRAEIEAELQQSQSKAERGMARVKLLKVNEWNLVRDRVYASFDIEVDARTERPVRSIHVGFLIYHKGNINQSGGGRHAVLKSQDVIGHRAANTRFTTDVLELGVGAISTHPRSVDGWEVVPFVSQINTKGKTDYVASTQDVLEFIKNGGSADQGLPMTYCDAALGQGRLNVPKLRSGVPGDQLETDLWRNVKQYCERGVMPGYGGSSPLNKPYYAPRGSALASTVSGTLITQPQSSNAGVTESQNAVAAGNSTNDRLSNALGYIRITDLDNIRVSTRDADSAYAKTRMYADIGVAIHNIPQTPMRTVNYGVLVQLKRDPKQMVIMNARYSVSAGKSDAIINRKTTSISGSTHSESNITHADWTSTNPNDYIFTPFVNDMKWRDGEQKKFVHTTKEIVDRITNP